MSDWHPLDRDSPLPVPEVVDNSDISNEDLLAILGGEVLPRDLIWRRERRKSEARRAEIMADLDNWLPAYFATFSTRELLRALKENRQRYAYFISGLGDIAAGLTEAVLKAELAKRPHVPNKPEAKVLRRQRARIAQGRSKSRDR